MEVQDLLDRINKMGIDVVIDKKLMDDILEEAHDADIQKYVIGYAEGDRKPDLTPSIVQIKDKNGNAKNMFSVAFYGDKPKGYIPRTIGKAYKLMEQWPDGTLHALFAGTSKVYTLGDWKYAEGFSPDEQIGDMQKGLAPRYGWHMGTGLPSTHHLMGIGSIEEPKCGYYSKSGAGHPKGSKRVWVEVVYDATQDYSNIAEQNPSKSEKDIRGLIPFGGFYMFQESNLSTWVISSAVKFNKILSEKERQDILKENGYDESEVWKQKVLKKHIKSAITRNINLVKNDTNKSEKYKKNINYLMALADKYNINLTDNPKQHKLNYDEIRLQHENIKASLFDNPELNQYMKKTDGSVLGFVRDNTIYLYPDKINSELVVHEYTHVWDKMIQQNNPTLWEEGKKLMKNHPLWNEVKTNPYYREISNNDDLIASEVHSRLSSNIKNFNGFYTLRKWQCNAMKFVSKMIEKFIGKRVMQPTAITLEKFVNMPIGDLLNGKHISKVGVR